MADPLPAASRWRRLAPGLRVCALAAATALAAACADVELRVALPFGDGMVLQRGAPVPVRGAATPGAEVTVTLAGAAGSARAWRGRADAAGAWRVELPPLEPGGPFELAIEAAGGRLVLRDVLVGDVWLCSGQSNMEWAVANAMDAAAEIAAARDPGVRHFEVPRSWAAEPAAELAGGAWEPTDPEHAGGFTAVGWFFARALRRHLDVPIGLVNSTWGGRRIEPWMSARSLGLGHAAVAELLARERDDVSDGPEEHKDQVPTLLYNRMIHPLQHFPVAGVLWYQGESNAESSEDAVAYRGLFAAMIEDWRRGWRAPDLPFLFVQLAPYLPPPAEPGASDWALLRESQAAALALPRTAQVVILDAGDADDVHPRNKQVVGERLALAARRVAYGEDVVHSGPVYRRHETRDGRVVIEFDQAAGGLVVAGPTPGALGGFAIAGADRRFVWAEATIEGEQVAVSSERVPEPIAVRYAWADNPEGANLANRAGLPASPFRTDSW